MQNTQTLANKLRESTKPAHQEVENLPYLKRYKSTDLQLEDHYFHLKEIHSIYMQLLVCLLQIKISEKDPESTIFFIQELIISTHAIDHDVNQLEKIINLNNNNNNNNNNQKLENCESTVKYKKYLASLKKPEEILAHCCVRWFGDSFGGQKIKKQITSIYNSTIKFDTKSKPKKNPPINFYNSAIPTSRLIKHLNALGKSDLFTKEKENNFLKEANSSFMHHKNIFQELENKRTQNKPDYTNKSFNQIATLTGAIILGSAIGYGCYKNM